MKTIPNYDHSSSPSVIVPLVMALVKPTSVVDWGCNSGVWLDSFKLHGVEQVHGLDVWPWDKNCHIEKEEFTQVNFEQEIPIRKCDLALNLENAEHLSESRADVLVDALTKSSPTILFSAATPGQGGDCHYNEQPHSYWHYKFIHKGFMLYDPIRWAIRDSPKVEWWYKNNMFIYSRIFLPMKEE
jgi:hypothetical protein